jgi:hypothetical protein
MYSRRGKDRPGSMQQVSASACATLASISKLLKQRKN